MCVRGVCRGGWLVGGGAPTTTTTTTATTSTTTETVPFLRSHCSNCSSRLGEALHCGRREASC